MQNNPYTLTFGKEPAEIIPRVEQTRGVLQSFQAEMPSQQVYMVTGVRGSGKTVFMTTISKRLREADDWIVVELNPERDLLTSLASKLSSEHALAQLFKSAKINLSFFGIGLAVEGAVPVTDIETALSKMLSALKKHKKRLLVTIDEVSNTPEIRAFASAFQIFVRQELPIFLLMTGLYENIYELQNERTLTFLYRAPKIELRPLSIGTISKNYQNVLHLPPDSALSLAKQTKGYSFAFQVLGYFTWEYPRDSERVQTEYKQYLEEYVYEKLWSELSSKDREVAYAIATASSSKVCDIRAVLNMDAGHFSPYRQRLIRKGLVNGDEYGSLYFTLPLFEQFVIENYIPF